MNCTTIRTLPITSAVKLFLVLLSVTPFFGNSAKNPEKYNVQPFSMRFGATRIIYTPNSEGATIMVANLQSYPILIQSRMLTEDMKKKAPFVVTPPLFRLEGQQQTRLRIYLTEGKFPEDRESLNWLCVKSIPPEPDSPGQEKTKSVGMNVQLLLSNCIKVFIRPEKLVGSSSEYADRITWQVSGSQLKANNPTPYYMNFASLEYNKTKINKLRYLAPFSSQTFDLPKTSASSGEVEWTVIDDLGGNSSPSQTIVR